MSTEQEVIVIQEEKDGSATIELPPSIPSPEGQDEHGSDEADERARAKEMVVGGAVDADAEALREQKRLKRTRRKEYHRQVSTEKDVKLTLLERQNQQLLERLSVLERKSHGSDLARLDKAIEDQDSRILFAKKKMAEATATGNGELSTSAQEMWFDARRQAEALQNLKKRAVAPQNQRTIQAPDPQLQRHASKWMSENTWYDPNGKDPDSRRALNEDSILAEEGYDPKTAESIVVVLLKPLVTLPCSHCWFWFLKWRYVRRSVLHWGRFASPFSLKMNKRSSYPNVQVFGLHIIKWRAPSLS